MAKDKLMVTRLTQNILWRIFIEYSFVHISNLAELKFHAHITVCARVIIIE